MIPTRYVSMLWTGRGSAGATHATGNVLGDVSTSRLEQGKVASQIGTAVAVGPVSLDLASSVLQKGTHPGTIPGPPTTFSVPQTCQFVRRVQRTTWTHALLQCFGRSRRSCHDRPQSELSDKSDRDGDAQVGHDEDVELLGPSDELHARIIHNHIVELEP